MRLDPLQLGPWPEGTDTLHGTTHAVFQPTEKRAARLAAAVNTALDDEGWPTLRAGLTETVAATAGLTAFRGGGMVLIQDGTAIKLVNVGAGSAANIVTGLTAEAVARFCAHAGQVYWTDGTLMGRLSSGTAYNFGCSLGPTPTLTGAAGSLPVGRYMVAVEPKDASGILHAANIAKVITTVAVGGITVSVSGVDANATHLRVYLAGPDDDVLYFKADVAVGSFPYTISTVPTEDTVCWSIGLSPPPAHTFAFSYQDRLMLVAGTWIYPSLGAATHLYDIGKTAVARPETILAAGGLPDGFWTVSSRGAYWSTGDQPASWRTVDQKFSCEFCAGSQPINTSMLPGLGLKGDAPAILFWSSWGLAVGLSGGQMLFPHKDQTRETVTGLRASFAYHESGDLNQLIVSVG